MQHIKLNYNVCSWYQCIIIYCIYQIDIYEVQCDWLCYIFIFSLPILGNKFSLSVFLPQVLRLYHIIFLINNTFYEVEFSLKWKYFAYNKSIMHQYHNANIKSWWVDMPYTWQVQTWSTHPKPFKVMLQ